MNKRNVILGLSALSLLGAALAQSSTGATTAKAATGTTSSSKMSGSKMTGSKMTGKSMMMSAVNVNTATLAELEKIPGMSARLAGEVVKARPFKNQADFVKKVKGIGSKNVAKFAKYLKFS